MGSVKKVGDDYFIEFFARGLKYQQKAGTSRKGAEQLLEEVESKIRKGEMGVIVRNVDVDIFLQDFWEDAKKTHTTKTVNRYQALSGHFSGFLKEVYPQAEKLSDITPKVVEDYKDHLCKVSGHGKRKDKSKLVNFSLALLSDTLKHGITLGYINDDPTLHVRRLPENPGAGIKTLTKPEFFEILEGCPEYLASVLKFVLYTGLNAREAAKLDWKDINHAGQCISIKSQGTRYGCGRDVPLTAEAFEALDALKEKYRPTGAVFRNANQKNFTPESLKEEMGQTLKDIKLHVFRDTFARNLVERGVGLALLYRILGFSDIAMARRYSIFAPVKTGGIH